MRRFAACIVVSAIPASSVFGGTVDFVGGELPGDRNTHVYSIVIADTDFSTFDSVTMLLGTLDDPTLQFSVEYGGAFFDSTTTPPNPAAEFGVYALQGGKDLFFGGSNTGGWSAPLAVAILTVDTTALNARGEMATLRIDSGFENATFGYALTEITGPARASEGLSGSVTVPEPATLMLLGLGGLAVVQRRKAQFPGWTSSDRHLRIPEGRASR